MFALAVKNASTHLVADSQIIVLAATRVRTDHRGGPIVEARRRGKRGGGYWQGKGKFLRKAAVHGRTK